MQAKAEVKANLKAYSQKLSLWAQYGGVGWAVQRTQTTATMTFVSVRSVAKGKAKRQDGKHESLTQSKTEEIATFK